MDRSTLTHKSSAVLSGKSTHEPWHYMACTYIFCEDDKAIPLAVQRDITEAMGSDITAIRIAASHSPFLSSPDALVKGDCASSKFRAKEESVESTSSSIPRKITPPPRKDVL